MMAGGRFAWLVGAIAILVAGYLTINAARPDAPGARGPAAGARLAPFAVPLAGSQIACSRREDPCDANVARRAGQGEAGNRPACEVRGPTVLNVCELGERGPLVLALLPAGDAGCASSYDVLAALRRGRPGLQVAVVVIGGKLADVRRTARERGWAFAVGWDRDGAVAALYAVAACPHVTIARWRGRVQTTLVGTLPAPRLRGGVADAVARSRAAGWRP